MNAPSFTRILQDSAGEHKLSVMTEKADQQKLLMDKFLESIHWLSDEEAEGETGINRESIRQYRAGTWQRLTAATERKMRKQIEATAELARRKHETPEEIEGRLGRQAKRATELVEAARRHRARDGLVSRFWVQDMEDLIQLMAENDWWTEADQQVWDAFKLGLGYVPPTYEERREWGRRMYELQEERRAAVMASAQAEVDAERARVASDELERLEEERRRQKTRETGGPGGPE